MPARAPLPARRRACCASCSTRAAYAMICTVSMPEISSKNQPQLVYISCAWRCISISSHCAHALGLVQRVRLVLRQRIDPPTPSLRSRITWMYPSRAAHTSLKQLCALLLGQRTQSHRAARPAPAAAARAIAGSSPACRRCSRSSSASAPRRARSSMMCSRQSRIRYSGGNCARKLP